MQIAPYQKVKDSLKKNILEGQFQDGDLLPSENVLAKTFGITRMTVRKALDTLVREGYIEKHQGKGSLVSARRKTLRLLSFRGFSDAIRNDVESVQTKMILSPKMQDWPSPFFYSLSSQEIRMGCIHFIRLRSIEEKPVMLEYTYLPNQDLKDLCYKPLTNNSLFATLNTQYHIDVNSVQQDIRAIACDNKTATFLKLNANDPALHIHRRYGTNRPEFYLYSSLFCNTQHYAIGNFFE